MHQSGQLRAHSMQTVQLSSLRAMTPRARGAGSSFSWGYCTVAAPFDGAGMSVLRPRDGKVVFTMVLSVTPKPLTSPGVLGAGNLAITEPLGSAGLTDGVPPAGRRGGRGAEAPSRAPPPRPNPAFRAGGPAGRPRPQ